ncbi:16S rRNA (adenine(1518)-N(6)/adenine(1519)-N(6))-dimethyltransferase RsmA [Sinanaerobacter sp. ZZT-01]|uniref:16S rRNA (adenine(1518)-N(6)/adenine(1519)-N(6))- dimethyltransferase RsmA n=1 Tax=Sinanaerobacter sp. ZZT-01 TaxID=3111540 RepID=UPI002D781CC6|nr:16S rRNA (adenine(1518)-N(6)/adenine(1519)-N(6))-dimethyltransferase RsmA [Sinanaerobacter sp. ZZT-01]WRR94801.1 16S rRNA (adenine(1518)-N(6)/adenine(1519)-N(6))-dimethyltransferase RsmA [Sinanaerobacter sp. ZZT-01]
MDKLYSPNTIRKIKEKYGFHLSKSLGQNFLTDANIIDKIIEGAQIGETDLVIEIGPGIGVLTAAAAAYARKVIAVEIDRNLIPILEETLKEYENISILHADILKTDLIAVLEQNKEINKTERTGVKIIGNLPYYITTPIIMKLLEEGVPVDSITIMMQKEVADRIKSGPGTKAYGALSVAVQYYCTVVPVASVPKEVFIPQPKVDSAVIRLDLRKEKSVKLLDEAVFFSVVKYGFGKRRKTLLNSLTGVMGKTKEEIAEALTETGIDPMRRAETLSIEEFASLSNRIAEK